MFSMFEEKSWDHRLFLFREAIVKRFVNLSFFPKLDLFNDHEYDFVLDLYLDHDLDLGHGRG